MLEKTIETIDLTLSNFLSGRTPIETLLLLIGAIHCAIDYFAIKYFRDQIDYWKKELEKEENRYNNLIDRSLKID